MFLNISAIFGTKSFVHCIFVLSKIQVLHCPEHLNLVRNFFNVKESSDPQVVFSSMALRQAVKDLSFYFVFANLRLWLCLTALEQ